MGEEISNISNKIFVKRTRSQEVEQPINVLRLQISCEEAIDSKSDFAMADHT